MQRFENKIIMVNSRDTIEDVKQASLQQTKVIELDGRHIPNECVLMDALQQAFQLPKEIYYEEKLDYMAVDWEVLKQRMKELENIPAHMNIMVIVTHYDELLREEVENKAFKGQCDHKGIFMSVCEQLVFFWGVKDIYEKQEKTLRGFNVYLVSDKVKEPTMLFSSKIWEHIDYTDENIKNELLLVTPQELKDKLANIVLEPTEIIEIDGENFLTVYDFVDKIVDIFGLPKNENRYRYSWDRTKVNWCLLYDDMTINHPFPDELHFVIVIQQYEQFLKMDDEKRKAMGFLENVRYYWEKYVFKRVKNGKARGFSIYAVGDTSNRCLWHDIRFDEVYFHSGKQCNPIVFIKNEMEVVTPLELAEKLNGINEEDTVIVELDGKELPDKLTFLAKMTDEFKLFGATDSNWDAYCSEMCFLGSFLEQINFVVVVHHYKELLAEDTLENRQIALEIFEDIRYGWEKMSIPRGFNIYLVD